MTTLPDGDQPTSEQARAMRLHFRCECRENIGDGGFQLAFEQPAHPSYVRAEVCDAESGSEIRLAG
jgi:hypothetical protein